MIIRLCAIPLLLSLSAAADDASDVVAAVQRLFNAMAAHDAAAMREIVVPEGQVFAVRGPAAPAAKPATLDEFAARIGNSKEALLERMWNPKTMSEGRMAVLWAPYDFHRDGKFSHCGVDTATLIKTPSGWKIAGLMYTVQTSGCAPSPLGPPK